MANDIAGGFISTEQDILVITARANMAMEAAP